MKDKVINDLKERLKDSAKQALKRHAKHHQPIVYKSSGKLVLEWANGEIKTFNPKTFIKKESPQ